MDDMLTMLTEFGAAGLIGMLWLIERRAATARERQIDEAHQRIMASNQQVTTLGEVIDRNTRAIENTGTLHSDACWFCSNGRDTNQPVGRVPHTTRRGLV